MRGVNKVILVGTLGGDPQIKQFTNGGTVANFSIATSEVWNDKNTGERREHTEWHRITLNNRLAEIAGQYLKKGSKVYIEGSLRTRQYTDQQGQERYITEVRGDNLQMLDSRGQGEYAQQGGGFGANPSYDNGQNFGGGYGSHGGYAAAPQSNQGYNQPVQNNFASTSAPVPQPNRSVNNNEPDDDLPF